MKHWYCKKKDCFIPRGKINHFCKPIRCKHLKLFGDVIYKLWGFYVNSKLELIDPQIGQYYAGKITRR